MQESAIAFILVYKNRKIISTLTRDKNMGIRTKKFFFHGWPVAVRAIMVIFLFGVIQGDMTAKAAQAEASTNNENQKAFQRMKTSMIKNQLIARDINDPAVIRAFEAVDRHRFVPEHLQDMAYEDRPLPIGEGQTISQPYIVAFMTQSLDLENTDRVLEIGTGSGYQAAILAEIAAHVYTIEIIESLGNQAKAVLDNAGYDNVDVKIGDGFKGWPEHAPFDAIIVTCAPTEIPDPLKEQLADGGTLVIPVGQAGNQMLRLFKKKDGKLVEQESLPVRFVPMVDESGKTY